MLKSDILGTRLCCYYVACSSTIRIEYVRRRLIAWERWVYRWIIAGNECRASNDYYNDLIISNQSRCQPTKSSSSLSSSAFCIADASLLLLTSFMYFPASFLSSATLLASLHSLGSCHILICLFLEAEISHSRSGMKSRRVTSESKALSKTRLWKSYRLTFLRLRSRKWWIHQNFQSWFQPVWPTKLQLWFYPFRIELHWASLVSLFQACQDRKHWSHHFQSLQWRGNFYLYQDTSNGLILPCSFGVYSVTWAFKPELWFNYMRNVIDLHLTDFSSQEESFVDVVLEHAHVGFFVRNAQNQG